MAIADPEARLDLVSLANGIRNDPDTSCGESDEMSYLIGERCEMRSQPIAGVLTNRWVTVRRRYDAEYYDELAQRHGLPTP